MDSQTLVAANDSSSDSGVKCLKVVYVFAGHRRRADVHEHLNQLAHTLGFRLEMHEFDLMRDPKHDVLQEEMWKNLKVMIQELKPFCVIATPPCSTYSRARQFYKVSPGPRPIRSRQFPKGFPWLSHANKQKADEGTKLAERAWDLYFLAHEIGATYLGEFPEDLGLTSTGVPASFWQMQQFQEVLSFRDSKTFSVFQCEFGAATPKPTRFVTDLEGFDGPLHWGAPQFDKDWKYIGPLPPHCPHPGQHAQLIGQNAEGQWKTSPAAHYPGPLCLFLAKAIVHTWRQSSFASLGPRLTKEVPEVQTPRLPVEDFQAEPHPQALNALGIEGEEVDQHDNIVQHCNIVLQSGCVGPALKAQYAGRHEEFCDGFGLCSPGRWHPNNRAKELPSNQLNFCQSIRHLVDDFCRKLIPDLGKGIMKLALGRCQGSPFSQVDLKRLREKWFNLLPDPHRASQLTEGQPFYLHALAQSLRLMGDPDTDILDSIEGSNFVNGVHVGHCSPLGPTPQVYRERIKKAIYDESEWTWCMDNYFRGDEEQAAQILETHFREEEMEGRMFPMSFKAASKKYPGSSLRIAAQGILDKPDGGHRIIHDGTHGVQLNNEIEIVDRLENPGPRELATIMNLSVASGERVIFGLNADVAKAHRRVKIREEDWGVLACKTASSSDVVWFNKTGTFGVASAAYWWSRLMGLVGRFAWKAMLNDWFFALIFVDDIHMASGGNDRWLALWRFIALLEMVGLPFSFHKFRGGFQMDFVGFWVDYARFEIGMSERRVAWLVSFVEELIANNWLIHMRRFQEFHGRLGFAAQVLPWIRPMLAPGYSWISAAGRTATLKMPQLVASTCIFIRDKFSMGYRKLPCGVSEVSLGEIFRTDAKCEKHRIVLGGWLLNEKGEPSTAPWFSLSLSAKEVPWLFREDGETSWASTSAELLASLVAIKVLPFEKFKSGLHGAHILHCGGGTDNKAAGSLASRKLSTKLPVMIVLMEYLSQCESMNIRCQLNWRPRDTNVEADDLTNEKFERFNLNNRIDCQWQDFRFPILEKLVGFTQSFVKIRAEHQLERPSKEAKFEKSKWD